MTWFAVHTGPRLEGIAKRHLERAGIHVYYPSRVTQAQRMFNTHFGPVRKLQVVVEPYFPRYLFVFLRGDQAIGTVNDTIGVSRVVSSRITGTPLPIPTDVMTALIDMTQSPEYAKAPPLFAVGDTVILDKDDSNSALNGLRAIVSSVKGLDKHRRVVVAAQMFGAEHDLDVSVDRVVRTGPDTPHSEGLVGKVGSNA